MTECLVSPQEAERIVALLTSLPELFRRTRAARGHSFRQASQLSDVTVMVLNDMENGVRQFGKAQVDTAVKILRYVAENKPLPERGRSDR